ncbi:hypothetical protein AB1Y20_022287 [Prymnesium parvum]|uniref:Uncharacterized protein n=1 Tax=Prymnesium parvum TaxID=97485 RepID=A0AB34JID8_PRYPA
MLPLEEEEDGLPPEELLRLDDGTLLPPELTEIRSLLQLQASLLSHSPSDEEGLFVPEAGLSEDELQRTAKLHALHAMKAEYVADCLLGFDEGLLFLHDKVLDHERLVRKLSEVRKRKAVRPVGKCRFDESFYVSDEEDNGSSSKDQRSRVEERAAPMDEMRELLAMDADDPGSWCDANVSDQREGDAAGKALAGTMDSSEDEEVIDQKVAESRQQIKSWVRALEVGSREPALPAILGVKPLTSKYSQRLRGTAAASQLRASK